MSKIRIVNGPYRGREKTTSDKPMTIGRDAEAGIQILDRSASRFHAEIFPVGGMFFVRDLESKNGTYVNDEKIIDEELLREGDVIKIGSTELIYESGSALADDESSGRISYRDDPDALSNTLEFRLDELSDIAESKDQSGYQDSARSLRILYQIGRMLSSGTGEGNESELRVLDYLVQAMPAESALIFRREGPAGKLVPVSVRTSAPLVQPVISRSIIKKTFSENKALHIANAQDDERFDRTASVIHKGIRSVICVPLAVAGHTRGVVYLSRSENAAPFDQIDLELVSAVAIQLGMTQHAHEQQRRHRTSLWKAVTGLVGVLEGRAGCLGSGERCARFCRALGHAMGLDAASLERLGHAGLLHHLGRIGAPGEGNVLDRFEGVDDFETILPLLRANAAGGRDADTDAETRILALAAAFELRTSSNPDADVQGVIDALIAEGAHDEAITAKLQSCHLDGSLYAITPASGAARTPPPRAGEARPADPE